jgi:hypothetical protein
MVIATSLLGMQRSSGFTKIESSVTKGPSFQNVARSLRELSAGNAGPHDGRRHARARSLRKLSLRSHARCESFPPATPALMTDGDLRGPDPISKRT